MICQYCLQEIVEKTSVKVEFDGPVVAGRRVFTTIFCCIPCAIAVIPFHYQASWKDTYAEMEVGP
jgi:hypothetical protein